jgi:hypothetical protein
MPNNPINNAWFRVTKSNGIPDFTPTSINWGLRYVCMDTKTSKYYEYNPVTKVWEETDVFKNLSVPGGGTDGREVELRATDTAIQWRYVGETTWKELIQLSLLKGDKGPKGDVGPQGAQGPQGIPGSNGAPGQAAYVSIGTVTTLAPGSMATVTNSGTSTNAVLNFGIPRGQDGSSGGGSVGNYLSFVEPQTTGTTQTLAQSGLTTQAQVTASYGSWATPSDLKDWAELQKAVFSGKTISLITDVLIHKPINYEVNRSNPIRIVGNFRKIKSTNNFSGYLIGRPTPSDINVAYAYMNPLIGIYDLQVEGYSNQTGIDFGASYGAYYHNIYCYNLNVGLHLKFALQTTIQSLRTWNCSIGGIADWYQGQSWAAISTTASNITSFLSPRLYSTNANSIGIAAYGADSPAIFNMVVEGTTAKHCFLFDAMGSTTVKRASVEGLHVECVNGLSDAAIKLNCPGGSVKLDGVIGHYADIMVDANSNGPLVVNVERVGWWVAKNGKVFRNRNCGWNFKDLGVTLYAPAPNTDSSLRNMFDTSISGYTLPNAITTAVTGYNLFKSF